MPFFSKKKKDKQPAEPRCGYCCNNCPVSSLKCDHGRELFGLPVSGSIAKDGEKAEKTD